MSEQKPHDPDEVAAVTFTMTYAELSCLMALTCAATNTLKHLNDVPHLWGELSDPSRIEYTKVYGLGIDYGADILERTMRKFVEGVSLCTGGAIEATVMNATKDDSPLADPEE